MTSGSAPLLTHAAVMITRFMLLSEGTWNITCVMITHNMQTAIDMGNRLLMMNEGKIILDLNKEEKEKMSIDELRDLFRLNTSSQLDDDRMILL